LNLIYVLPFLAVGILVAYIFFALLARKKRRRRALWGGAGSALALLFSSSTVMVSSWESEGARAALTALAVGSLAALVVMLAFLLFVPVHASVGPPGRPRG
jgi:predicted permease